MHFQPLLLLLITAFPLAVVPAPTHQSLNDKPTSSYTPPNHVHWPRPQRIGKQIASSSLEDGSSTGLENLVPSNTLASSHVIDISETPTSSLTDDANSNWVGQDNMVVGLLERTPGLGYVVAGIYNCHGKKEESTRAIIRCTAGIAKCVVNSAGGLVVDKLPIVGVPVTIAAGSLSFIVQSQVESYLSGKLITDPEILKKCRKEMDLAHLAGMGALGAAHSAGWLGFSHLMNDVEIIQKNLKVASSILSKTKFPLFPNPENFPFQ